MYSFLPPAICHFCIHFSFRFFLLWLAFCLVEAFFLPCEHFFIFYSTFHHRSGAFFCSRELISVCFFLFSELPKNTFSAFLSFPVCFQSPLLTTATAISFDFFLFSAFFFTEIVFFFFVCFFFLQLAFLSCSPRRFHWDFFGSRAFFLSRFTQTKYWKLCVQNATKQIFFRFFIAFFGISIDILLNILI